MRNIYLKVPSSREEWLTVAEKFESRWQFPNCIGAIDGKHTAMQPNHLVIQDHIITTTNTQTLIFL